MCYSKKKPGAMPDLCLNAPELISLAIYYNVRFEYIVSLRHHPTLQQLLIRVHGHLSANQIIQLLHTMPPSLRSLTLHTCLCPSQANQRDLFTKTSFVSWPPRLGCQRWGVDETLGHMLWQVLFLSHSLQIPVVRIMKLRVSARFVQSEAGLDAVHLPSPTKLSLSLIKAPSHLHQSGPGVCIGNTLSRVPVCSACTPALDLTCEVTRMSASGSCI